MHGIGRLPSDEDLFTAIVRLAEHLDDGHINLRARDLRRTSDAWVSEYPYTAEMEALEKQVEAVYLNAPLRWAAEDWFAWGTLDEPDLQIGYLSITSMDGLSRQGSERKDIQAAEDAMQQVLADLGDHDGLIVDIRANEGGWDAVSLAITAHFAGRRSLAWSKQHRDGPSHDDFTDWQDSYATAGRAGAYSGPVVVLTSGGTFSAAETFVLAMHTRDAVTVMGERTSGHFSDMMEGQLPNGWTFTFSGERYRSATGDLVEVVGAPVDVAVPFDLDAFEAKRDTMLEAAVQALKGQ